MRTTVYIPDEIFAEGEGLAKRMKKSRSQLYADALRDYIACHDPNEITASINRVVLDPRNADPETDAFVAEAARLTLKRVEWED